MFTVTISAEHSIRCWMFGEKIQEQVLERTATWMKSEHAYLKPLVKPSAPRVVTRSTNRVRYVWRQHAEATCHHHTIALAIQTSAGCLDPSSLAHFAEGGAKSRHPQSHKMSQVKMAPSSKLQGSTSKLQGSILP